MRDFARKLQLSPSSLSEVYSGRRKITRKLAGRIADRLQMDPAVSRPMLEDLPEKERRIRNPSAKLLKAQAPERTVDDRIQLSSDQFSVIADWYCYGILSLAETRDFDSDPRWIAQRLGLRKRDVITAIERLVRLEMLIRKKNGKLIPTGKTFTSTKDVSDPALRKHHAQGLELARQALEELPVLQRHLSSSTIAIDPDRLEEGKAMLVEMRKKVAQFLGGGSKREVYRLQVQLIPLSRKP
jgi:uncharacterized protein (TIGR02147 family)